jgi:cobalt-zinc-cadmium resistance protein CzcA
MINKLVEFSIKNRFLVIFAVLLIGALGIRAVERLPIDAIPDVTNIQVQVLTSAPALGPLEVEQFITSPVETVMSGLPNIEEVRSVSRFGLSAVTIVFQEGTDIYFARQLVLERLQEAKEEIPEGYGSPEMGPISSGLGEIYQFEVKSDSACKEGAPDTEACYTSMELRTILDWYIAYQLRSVQGVVEVNSFGGELKTFEVQVNPARLTALGISLSQVFEALEKNNSNAGGAYIARAGEQYLIRGEGLLQDVSSIRRIIVSTPEDSRPITIGDIGKVALAPMVRQGAVTRDGDREAVTGIVMMLLGANSRQVVSDVKARIEEIKPTLPSGVSIETFYDRTELIDRAISTVSTNLIEGGVLVIVILLLMLGNIRGGLLVASVIPLSMLVVFIAMDYFKISGNLMSLGALDFGLIVDGSVVMIENMVRFLSHRGGARGEQLDKAVKKAAREVTRPIVFAVAIIMIVYLPILTLEGIEGKMFKPMALTVIFALAASLIFSLTLMPAMAPILFRNGVSEGNTRLMLFAQWLYTPILRGAMNHPRKVSVISVLFFVGSLSVIPLMGAEFIPTLDEGAIAMQAVRLPSVSLEESIEATKRIEKTILQNFPDEVATVVSKTGRAEIATDPMGVDISDIFINLTPQSQWKRSNTKEELVELIEHKLRDEVPGQNFSFSQPIELRTNELLSGVRSDVAVSIYGDDLAVLKEAADEVARLLNQVEGASDVKAEQVAGLPVLRVKIEQDKIARYGINASDVLDTISAIGGKPVGEIFEGNKRFTLQVRYIESARNDLEQLRAIPIASPSGVLVPLGQLAKLEVEEGPAQISREKAQRKISIEANVRGRDLAGFVAEAREKISAAKVVPRGYFVEWGGQFENLEAASERLLVAVPLALMLIFVLLYMAYGAVRPAIIIYLNVPFAATGGLLALWARGMPFSISAGVGFIALFGVAVLNGVVLVSYIRSLQERGFSSTEAASQGALTRLRPVLMTAMVASFGFIPMALATSAGAEVQRPLATVVIGGLVTSTLLTLVVLPSVYGWLGEELHPSAVKNLVAKKDTKPDTEEPKRSL